MKILNLHVLNTKRKRNLNQKANIQKRTFVSETFVFI